MFEDRSYKRTFYSAPQSVTSLVAALLEPGIAVLTYFAVCLWFDEPLVRSDYTLAFLVVALTFPGRNRFKDNLLSAGVDLISAWLIVLAILALGASATQSMHFFDPEVLLWWAVLTPLLQWTAVWLGQRITRYLAILPHNRRASVVIGAGPLGVKVAKALLESTDLGIDFVGYFDDRTDDRLHSDAVPQRLGSLKEAAPYILQHAIHDVYITLPLGSQPRIVELLEQVQGTTASVFFVPDVFGISIIQGRLQDMNGVPVVGICETPFTGTNELVKRVSDIVLASHHPGADLAAAAVRSRSASSSARRARSIFKQRRYGLDGDEIMVYKFRSMRPMDNGDVIKQATKGDPRITRFGAFLRRTSLDELPQFINVLQGRMSIVGPRPHAVAHNELYRQLIKAYMVRHKVKPGITGWAQVNGMRGETDTLEKMQARVEYDLEYLRNWSLGLDLQIIARTIKVVLFDRNAY